MNPDGTAAVGKWCLFHLAGVPQPPWRVQIVQAGYSLAGRWWCVVRRNPRAATFYAPLDRLEVIP